MKKCSGKYHKNEAAARYVHQMAEEIVSQLAGVADEIKKHQGEPEMFQALLDEWTANFPPSLGEFGSPRAIAAKLARQELEIADLKDAFESAVAAREKDVTDILRSMDAQLHAYRGSVMSERQQQKVLQDHRISSYEQAISDIISKHDRELEEVSRSYARGAEKAKTEYSYSIAACNSQISLLKTTVEENKITYERQLSDVLRQKDGEIAKLTKHLQIAEEKYYSLADRFDEEVTVLSDYFTDMDIEEISAKGDTEEKDMGDGGNVSSPNNIQQNKRSKKRVPKQSFSTDHNSRNRAEEQASISRSRAATIGLNELNKVVK